MSTETSQLDAELKALFAAETTVDSPHLDAEEVAAYLAGDLRDDARERLQRHIEGCRACLELVLDVEQLATPEAPSSADVVDFEREAAWRGFGQRLASLAAPPARPPESRSGAGLRAVAAGLALLVLGLGIWAAHLSRSRADLARVVADLEAPRINVPVAYLDAVRSSSAAATIDLPAGDGYFLLMVSPSDPHLAASYRVEITDAGGAVVWTGAGLRVSEVGTLRLGMTGRMLPAGEYRLQVFGEDPASARAVGDYALVIRDPST